MQINAVWPRACWRLLVLFVSVTSAGAQDLVPGAFTPAPVGVNVLTVAATIDDGGVTFDPSLPVENGHAFIQVLAVVFNRTLGIAGRSANVGIVLPYLHGHGNGVLLGQAEELSRSGPGDLAMRVTVNLFGAPAMMPRAFAAYRPKTLLGVTVAVAAPTGQYDSAKSINIGSNRWAMKPELGFSHTRDRWTFELDVGASFFADNTDFRNGGRLSEAPIVAAQTHLIYTVRPGLWVAGDGNFWKGGRLTTNGIAASEEQQNSRLGVTVAVPIQRQQVRIAYSYGAYTTIGGDFKSLGMSYSYAWAGHP